MSAWFSPEARPAIVAIVVAATIKGVIVGFLAGLVAQRRQSVPLGVAAGLIAGFVLSMLAAIGQGDHYVEIVLPGMLVGALAGFITQRYPRRGRAETAALLVMLVPLVATPGFAGTSQSNSQPTSDQFAAIAPLLGRWKGSSDGQPGTGSVERSYERVLNGRFIRVRNRSEYLPQPKNPKGEIHEDEGLFSFDRARKRIVFRQFHVERFVNTYVEDPSTGAAAVVFITEAIENIPPGWRARETYRIQGPDAFEEVFELAESGKEFEVYSRTRFERVK